MFWECPPSPPTWIVCSRFCHLLKKYFLCLKLLSGRRNSTSYFAWAAYTSAKWVVRLPQHSLQVHQSALLPRESLHWREPQLPIVIWQVYLSVRFALTMCCHQFFSARAATLSAATVVRSLHAAPLAGAHWAPFVTWRWKKWLTLYCSPVSMPLQVVR